MWHRRSKRTETGGIKRLSWKKKRSERGSNPLETRVGEAKLKKKRVRGGTVTDRLAKSDKAALFINGKGKVVNVLQVVSNSANLHYARRNVMTKGAVIEIEDGGKKSKAVVTNRPSREGTVNCSPVKE